MNIGFFDKFSELFSGEQQLIADLLLTQLILLLALFASLFRLFFPLFRKMAHGFLSFKERVNLFDASMKDSFLLKCFLIFQTLSLTTIFLFLVYCRFIKQVETVRSALLIIAVIFVSVTLFLLFKICLYLWYGSTFNENGKLRLWKSNYAATFYFWGVSLYFPTLVMVLNDTFVDSMIVLFIILYLIFRVVFVYITVRIFYSEKIGLLFFSSYLCAQEIVPVVLLYRGVLSVRSFIEITDLWL